MKRLSEYQKAQKWLEKFEWDDSEETSETLATICDALQEVEKYRTAEEQGFLLRLQVKPGDTIYQPIGKDINDYKVIGLCYNMAEKEWLYELAIQIGVNWIKTSCSMDCIGKTVFLTKEEAEKALSERKNDE